jgi:hypothetical protein
VPSFLEGSAQFRLVPAAVSNDVLVTLDIQRKRT